MFDAPHAETHAVVLPYAIRYLQPAVPGAMQRLAEAMGAQPAQLAHRVWSLARSVGTPQGLRALGITEHQIGLATKAALAKNLTSPRPLHYDSLFAMLHAAWAGQPPRLP
jgi:maleylacetate reductase